METLHIHDWEEHQTYRKDRGSPPWIKVHKDLLTNTKIAMLTDREFGQLVKIWLVGSSGNGIICSDPVILRKIAGLQDNPNIDKYQDLKLLEPVGRQLDVNLTSTRRQFDAPEEEEEAEPEAETETEEEAEENTPSSSSDSKRADSGSLFLGIPELRVVMGPVMKGSSDLKALQNFERNLPDKVRKTESLQADILHHARRIMKDGRVKNKWAAFFALMKDLGFWRSEP